MRYSLCMKRVTAKYYHTDKYLQYSTGNAIQYPVMASMGKEAKERVDACVSITTQQIRTQLNIVNQLYVNKN